MRLGMKRGETAHTHMYTHIHTHTYTRTHAHRHMDAQGSGRVARMAKLQPTRETERKREEEKQRSSTFSHLSSKHTRRSTGWGRASAEGPSTKEASEV